MNIRFSRPLVIPLLLLGTLIAGCQRGSGPDLTPEIQRLSSELEATRRKLDEAEKTAATKQEDAALSTAADSPKAQPPEPDANGAQNDAQVRALQTELAELKKRDAFIYAEASASFKTGATSTALDRYQQFLRDFPNSPLATDADRAVTELSAIVQREARSRAMLADPRHADREAVQHFRDGIATVKEIAPVLKSRSLAEVLKVLGPPSQTFRDGKEIGYEDKVIDTATGRKGTLVIGFESDSVATLRIGYLGSPIKP